VLLLQAHPDGTIQPGMVDAARQLLAWSLGAAPLDSHCLTRLPALPLPPGPDGPEVSFFLLKLMLTEKEGLPSRTKRDRRLNETLRRSLPGRDTLRGVVTGELEASYDSSGLTSGPTLLASTREERERLWEQDPCKA
jgi:hypothetical protein